MIMFLLNIIPFAMIDAFVRTTNNLGKFEIPTWEIYQYGALGLGMDGKIGVIRIFRIT